MFEHNLCRSEFIRDVVRQAPTMLDVPALRE